jgi:type I restriction enzyme, S subunit
LRPYLNKVVIPNFAGAASAEFIVFSGAEILEPRYLQRVLMSPRFVSFASLKSTGDRPRVSYESIGSYEVLIPPIKEQQRIAAKIDSLSAKSKRARDELDRIPRLVEKYKQAILAAAFSGKLMPELISAPINENVVRDHRRELATKLKVKPWKSEKINLEGLRTLPKGWTWMRIGDVAVHQSGIAFKSKTFGKSGTQVIRLGNLYGGQLDISRSPIFLSPHDAPAGTFTTQEDDVLVSLTGTKYKRDYGFFIKLPHSINVFVNQRVLCLSCTNSLVPDFLVYFSQTPQFREWFFSTETGGVNQGNVPVAGVMEAPIPVPSVDAQKKLASRVNTMFRWVNRLASEATSARKLIDHLDQAVLAKAFRGELVLQDPNDEPASVLLERIRAERGAAHSPAKHAAPKQPKRKKSNRLN